MQHEIRRTLGTDTDTAYRILNFRDETRISFVSYFSKITNFLLTHILWPISYRRIRRIKISAENSHGFSTKRSIIITFIIIRGIHICNSNNESPTTNDAIHSIPNHLLPVAPLRKRLSSPWSCFFVHNNTNSWLLQDCLSDNLAFLRPAVYKLHQRLHNQRCTSIYPIRNRYHNAE